VLATVAAGFSGFYGLWLAVPVALAVAIVAARRMRPLKATFVGAAVTFAVVVAAIFPQLLIRGIQGGFDNTDYCDGFCFTNSEGFLFATYIMLFIAIPTGIVGGIIALITSLVASVTASPAHRA
jgi:hypothetical protein